MSATQATASSIHVISGEGEVRPQTPTIGFYISLVCFIDGIGPESNFICIGHLGIKLSKIGSIDEVENGTKISFFSLYVLFSQ